MPSHVDTGSKSDKAAAAQGRKFMGRIYNTVEQKQAAQRAKASFSKTPPKPGKKAGGPSKAVVGAPAGGWGPSEVVEKEVEFTLDDGMIDQTVKLKLFRASFGSEVEGVSDAAEVQVLGVRVRVTYPPGVPYARFALACITNDAAAHKPLEDVAAVSGSVVSSKNDHLAAFFNVPLVGVPTVRLAAGNEEPSTTLYLRFVAGGDEDHPSASFRFYVTCRKAKVGTASHVL